MLGSSPMSTSSNDNAFTTPTLLPKTRSPSSGPSRTLALGCRCGSMLPMIPEVRLQRTDMVAQTHRGHEVRYPGEGGCAGNRARKGSQLRGMTSAGFKHGLCSRRSMCMPVSHSICCNPCTFLDTIAIGNLDMVEGSAKDSRFRCALTLWKSKQRSPNPDMEELQTPLKLLFSLHGRDISIGIELHASIVSRMARLNIYPMAGSRRCGHEIWHSFHGRA